MGAMVRALKRSVAHGIKGRHGSIPGHIVHLQHVRGEEWVTRRGPECEFSATGPQVDADGNPVAHNYIPYSEPSISSQVVLISGSVVGPSSGDLSAFSDNAIAFGDNSITSVAYPHTEPNTAISHVLSFLIEMDDGGIPIPNDYGVGDFSVVMKGAVDHIPTVQHVSGSAYRVTTVRATLGTNTTFGVIKYDSQSARGFKCSCFSLTRSSVLLPYIKTTGSAAFAPSITDKGLAAMGAWTQMLQNSKFAGAISGTPGTAPTNWIRSAATTGVGLDFPAPGVFRAYTLSTGQGRSYLSQTINVLANTVYHFTQTILVVSVGETGIRDLFNIIAPPSGSTLKYLVDGVEVDVASALIVGEHRVRVELTVSSTAGTAAIRSGVGVSSGTVFLSVDATFSNLQVCSSYQYPYAASGPGQTVTVPASSSTTGGNGTNTLNSKEMLEVLRGIPDGINRIVNPVDGNFDSNSGFWTLQSGVTIESGVLRFLNSSSSAYRAYWLADFPVEVNTNYMISFDLINVISGGFRFLGGGGPTIGPFTESGHYEIPYTTGSTTATLYLQNYGISTFDLDNLKIQKLLPSQFTAVALVYVGVGSGELLGSGTSHNVLSCNSSEATPLYFRGDPTVVANSLPASAYDGSSYAFKTGTWNRDEIHLKCVGTNPINVPNVGDFAGKYFRVSHMRFTSTMVPIDADIVDGPWTLYDGSMNPLTHLRLALNGVIPLWFLLSLLSNKSMSKAEIKRALRYIK